LSAGLWRGWRAFPDALGVAVRFGTSAGARAPGELDLLFGTFRYLWHLPLAPFTTDTRDFFANTYWAVLPFDVDGLGRCRLRLRPVAKRRNGEDRLDRLRRAVAAGEAEFVLEARTGSAWQPLARILLLEELPADPIGLRFEPYATGRGVRPLGFLTELRRVVYVRVQAARTVGKYIR
ncbi:MAG: hypothetical protein ACOZNI_22265, partial [Myxococcota bacterium]